jgi:phytoene dehydrogenase-like protein
MSSYDVIIIGAGMSGLAAAARLSLFDKKVLLLEKHSIPGGLNSYYQRRNHQLGGIRYFDVGLHALTNFARKGERGKPLTKLLKQLRISYDELSLKEQSHSLISFDKKTLKFTNDFNILLADIETHFPSEFSAFCRLVEDIKAFNELDLSLTYSSTRKKLLTYFKDPLLLEMILCPLLIYGSAWEEDMDFAQFVIMFKSIYLEGFARPEGGVRRIISLLMNKLQAQGVEVRFKTSVGKILVESEKAIGVEVNGGEVLKASVVLSSIGYPETMGLIDDSVKKADPQVGKMTFMESLLVFDKKIPDSIQPATIIFHNDSSVYHYEASKNAYDPRSAVICFPDHYEMDQTQGEGMARVTYMANYDHWRQMDKKIYDETKDLVIEDAKKLVSHYCPGFDGQVQFRDVFSPMTIERYTWHWRGTVYGSVDKTRDGRTPIDKLFIIGTDQGFLGIVGAMLSGISMANLHVLMNEAT